MRRWAVSSLVFHALQPAFPSRTTSYWLVALLKGSIERRRLTFRPSCYRQAIDRQLWGALRFVAHERGITQNAVMAPTNYKVGLKDPLLSMQCAASVPTVARGETQTANVNV